MSAARTRRFIFGILSGRPGTIRRPRLWESRALPTELLPRHAALYETSNSPDPLIGRPAMDFAKESHGYVGSERPCPEAENRLARHARRSARAACARGPGSSSATVAGDGHAARCPAGAPCRGASVRPPAATEATR